MNQAGQDHKTPVDDSGASDADTIGVGDIPAADEVTAALDEVTAALDDVPTHVSDVPPHDDDPPSHAAGPADWTRRSSEVADGSRRRVGLFSWKGLAVIFAALVVGAAAAVAALAPTIVNKQHKISALERQKSSIQASRNKLASRLNSRESKQRADEAAAQRAFQERMNADAAQKKKDDAAAKAAAAASVAAKDTVDHDAVFAIGTDKNAGRYSTDGTAGCYYAILNSPDTADIAFRARPAGPTAVDLPAGKFFQTVGCGMWKRVG